MHVVVIGAGIGGLCLAQGLRRAGVSVAVYERDRESTARVQGYRVHIDPMGSKALNHELPPVLWQAFVDTAGDPGTTGFGFLTEQMRTMCLVEDEIFRHGKTDAANGHHAVSRVTLRTLLLAGLDDVVHFDKEFVRYERDADGRVTAEFADGTTATGDVLVGADGTNSRVRAQYLPNAEKVDVGAAGIGGKLYLDDETRKWVGERISGGMNVIMGPRDFLFTAVFNRRRSLAQTQELLGDKLSAAGFDPAALLSGIETRDYLLWAFITRTENCPADADGERLRDFVGARMETWNPTLRRIISDTEAETVNLFAFRSSLPLKPWESTNITLLGDAVHSMTPAGGVGANTALQDAALLAHALTEVDNGRGELVPAIHDYEAKMLVYGFANVRKSLTRAKQAKENRISRAFSRTFLRTCGLIPALRRVVFEENWSADSDVLPAETVAKQD
jgi:2-polyprenyl-6-methoxyphenol hydroxylase-like FAD-dependent oxidoreductase